ncbi:MAG: His/Gly/Thr/Pro-type tRNA ligase C-terminal domain-containing protein, partial [Crocinitomicaceae bacterium]
VDHETLEHNTVTIRNRDTMLQERVSVADLSSIIAQEASWKSILEKL